MAGGGNPPQNGVSGVGGQRGSTVRRPNGLAVAQGVEGWADAGVPGPEKGACERIGGGAKDLLDIGGGTPDLNGELNGELNASTNRPVRIAPLRPTCIHGPGLASKP